MKNHRFVISVAFLASLFCSQVWACGDVEDQLLFRVDPPGEVTFSKGNTKGGNNCIEKDHTWKGPKLVVHHKEVEGLGCATSYYIYCNDVVVSPKDDPTLSEKIYLPFPVRRFPDGFRISKEKFDDTKRMSATGCVNVVLALGNKTTYESCLKQVKYMEPTTPKGEQSDAPVDPSEIVFPGSDEVPASPALGPILGPSSLPSPLPGRASPQPSHS